MSPLFELHERPDLDSPVLIMTLEGWIDAGLGAQRARARIEAASEGVVVASFDTDALLDHRARRPSMQLRDGVHAGLVWPGIELSARTDADGTEFLLLSGAEPDHSWRAFSAAVVDLALEFGTRLVVGLGAYPAPVPHTRPTGLASTATTAPLAAQVGFVHGSITVPAGVQAAIEDRAGAVGLPGVGLWAQVPHYAAAMPYPAATLALLEGLERVAELRVDHGGLDEEIQGTRDRIDQLVAGSRDHEDLVRQLEAQADALTEPGTQLPSGDELAEELERFLRERDD